MKKVGIGVILFLLMLFGFLSYRWIKHRMEYAITDAVFVRADTMSNVSFEVSGKVVEVYKDMGDRVKKGELLARLEPEDYRLHLESLQMKLNSLLAQKEALELQLKRSKAQIDLGVGMVGDTLRELKAKEDALIRQVQELEVQIQQIERDRQRAENLFKEGLIPKQRFEQIDTTYKSLQLRKKALEDSLRELRAVYSRTQREYEKTELERIKAQELSKQIEALEKDIGALETQIQQAKLNLERTELRSPIDGIVAKRFISVGDMVRVGQPAFSLIDPESFYVEALLEETKLRGVKPGSKAYVMLDAYKGVVFEGVVEEISTDSAATVDLLTRDVSAGEFTKVVQRIPVKIRITKGDKSLLRVGMGGKVEIRRE